MPNATKRPILTKPPPLKPGQARRILRRRDGEKAADALNRAKRMTWGERIVSGPLGVAGVWMFVVTEAS